MKIQRVFTRLLTLCLLILLLAVSVSAEEIIASGLHDFGPIKWKITSDGTLTISGNRTMQEKTTYEWADYTNKITKVVIDDGMKSVSENAFRDMTNVTEIYLGNGLQAIYESAFENCTALCSVSFPSTLERIELRAFYGCSNLSEIKFASNTESLIIGNEAFSQLPVKELTFPGGVKIIGDEAFFGCDKLTTINLSEGLEEIGFQAFSNCPALSGHLYLPASLEAIGVGNITGNSAWTSVEINMWPSGGYSFQDCTTLKRVTYGGDAVGIGYYVFKNCTNLESVTINAEITKIHSGAFDGCSALRSIQLPETLQIIASNAFKDSGLTTITLPKSITEVQEAFTDCKDLKQVTFAGDAPDLAIDAFRNVTATVYYPASNDTWTEAVRQDYCGELTWIPRRTIELKIITQPKTVYAKQGATAKVTVKAEGDDLQYQWYMKNAGASKFSKSSVTTSTYSAKMTDKVKDRQVYCVITDANGKKVQTKTVTLRMAATIVRQPEKAAVSKGEIAKVSFQAAGDGLTYEWYFKDKGSTSFKKTTSFTGNTYSVEMTAARHGRQIYCKVTDKYGKIATTDTVTISIKPAITTQPKTTYTKMGATAKATVKATGDGLTYQWYIKNAGASKFSKSSVTAATYTVTMSSKAKDRQIYCIVTDQYGNSVKSNTVYLRMAATITTQPKTTYAAQGSTAKVSLAAAGDGLTYQWYSKNASATKFSKSSVTAATYSTTMRDAVNGRQLYCVVTDKYGNTVKTNTVTIKMK